MMRHREPCKVDDIAQRQELPVIYTRNLLIPLVKSTLWHLPFAFQHLTLAGFSLKDAMIYSVIEFETGIICRKNGDYSINDRSEVGYRFFAVPHWPIKPEQGLNLYGDLGDLKEFHQNLQASLGIQFLGSSSKPITHERKVAGGSNFSPFIISNTRFTNQSILFEPES